MPAHSSRFCAARFPPLSEGGFGGVKRLVRTRASDQRCEELKSSAVADADTPPDPPSERGGDLAARAQQKDRRAGDPVGPVKANFASTQGDATFLRLCQAW